GVTENRQAPIHTSAAWPRGLLRSMGERPEDAACRGVQRDDVVRSLDGVHDAVDDNGRRFELFEGACLVDPLHFEVLHILRSDLRQRAITLAVVISGIGEPVLGFLAGVNDPLVRHLRLKRERSANNEHDEQNWSIHKSVIVYLNWDKRQRRSKGDLLGI